MAGHVINLATKFEAPTPIPSWVMSDNVLHWLPLKMHTRPLRMHQITWSVSTGSKTITFLESPTLICLFTIHFYWAMTTIKGRLLSSVTNAKNAKALDCVNFLCATLWPWPLTLNSYRTWRVTWPILPPSLKPLCRSLLELWVITFPIENACTATAHAPNHVTGEQGVKNNYILEYTTPICLLTIQLRWLYDEYN